MMINQFLDYLRYERNTSPLTVQTYEESLRDFASYLTFRDNDLSLGSVDTDLIRDWMESLMDKGNSASTINKKLSALRSFYRFALKRQLVKADPAHAVVGPKKSKPLPQFLREGEMDRLIDGIEWDSSFNNVRARTILLLFYEAGLRRAELVSLNDRDVDFDAAQLKVTGKRNKQRIVPFGAELAEVLKQYQSAQAVSVCSQRTIRRNLRRACSERQRAADYRQSGLSDREEVSFDGYLAEKTFATRA